MPHIKKNNNPQPSYLEIFRQKYSKTFQNNEMLPQENYAYREIYNYVNTQDETNELYLLPFCLPPWHTQHYLLLLAPASLNTITQAHMLTIFLLVK